MQGGWGKAPARAVEVLRTEGPRSLFFKILGETFYRRLDIVEHDLTAPLPTAPAAPSVECRPLEPADIPAYRILRSEADPHEIRRRLDRGHLCMAAWCDGAIANAAWAGFGRCWVEYLDLHVEVGPRAAYLYEIWTDPAFRGRRISLVRWIAMAELLRAKGIDLGIGAQWPENRAVSKSAARAGFRSAGRLGFIQLGPWRQEFCRYTGSPDLFRLVD